MQKILETRKNEETRKCEVEEYLTAQMDNLIRWDLAVVAEELQALPLQGVEFAIEIQS